jgi:hypothetical protein
VYFINDASGVFDCIQFSSDNEAVQALQRNGFVRYAETNEAKKLITPPKTPFFDAQHPYRQIYSSGKCWC